MCFTSGLLSSSERLHGSPFSVQQTIARRVGLIQYFQLLHTLLLLFLSWPISMEAITQLSESFFLCQFPSCIISIFELYTEIVRRRVLTTAILRSSCEFTRFLFVYKSVCKGVYGKSVCKGVCKSVYKGV